MRFFFKKTKNIAELEVFQILKWVLFEDQGVHFSKSLCKNDKNNRKYRPVQKSQKSFTNTFSIPKDISRGMQLKT